MPTDASIAVRPVELAVVGAGQIGFRHLQALGRLSFAARTWVVDAVKPAAQAACARAGLGTAEVARAAAYDELPPALDVAIIATTADCRLAALEQLLRASRVKHVVLEKVLFQSDADFARAAELLAASESVTWVNCGRRIYPIYQRLRATIAERGGPVWMAVTGSNIRLGTNLIHLVDLFAFLTGDANVAVDAEGVLDPPIASKRAGCLEFDGTVRMSTPGGHAAEVHSLRSPTLARHVVVRIGDATWIIDEMTGELVTQEEHRFRVEKIELPMQSEMSNRFVEDLVARSACALTPYDESVALHRRMFEGLDRALGPRWPQWSSGGARPIT